MKNTKSVRAALLASVKQNVEHLVKRNRFRALEMVMEATGYLSNLNSQTSKSLGAAIVGLASTSTIKTLTDIASVAAFERSFGRTNKEDIWPAAVPGRWERANAYADETLHSAGVDVDLRSAKALLAEARMMANHRAEQKTRAA